MTEKPANIAVRLASRIERRRFLRLASQATFVAVAGIAVGEGLGAINPPKAYANPCGNKSNKAGLACPNGGEYGYAPCGPSPCCAHYSGGCNCAGSSPGSCKTSGYCAGDGYYYSGTNCWSCAVSYAGQEFITTCCDCSYKSAYYDTCKPSSGYYAGRCISWWTGSP
jgi:hypothetical protein